MPRHDDDEIPGKPLEPLISSLALTGVRPLDSIRVGLDLPLTASIDQILDAFYAYLLRHALPVDFSALERVDDEDEIRAQVLADDDDLPAPPRRRRG